MTDDTIQADFDPEQGRMTMRCLACGASGTESGDGVRISLEAFLREHRTPCPQATRS